MKTKLLIFLFSIVLFFGLTAVRSFLDLLNSMEEMALLVAAENKDFQENEEKSKEIKDGYDENINILVEDRFVFVFFGIIKKNSFHFSFTASGFVPGLISPPPEVLDF